MPFWVRVEDQKGIKRSFSLRGSIFHTAKSKKPKRPVSQTSLVRTLKRQGSRFLDVIGQDNRSLSPRSRTIGYHDDGSAFSAPATIAVPPSVADNLIFCTSSLQQPALPAGFIANEEHYRDLQNLALSRDGSPSTNPTSSSSGKATTIASKQAVDETPASSVTRSSSKKKRSSEEGAPPTVVHRPLLAARPIVLPHDGSSCDPLNMIFQTPVHKSSRADQYEIVDHEVLSTLHLVPFSSSEECA
jgi:hypothetical protein